MRIQVDYQRCEGHGHCADQAAAVFTIDEEGELTYRYEGQEVPDEFAGQARAAIASCPVAALRELT
jgi:ferredoxin